MLLMHHFGEPNFTPGKCGGTCDVCASGAPDSVEPQDLTPQAQQLVRLLQLMGEGMYSSTYLLEVWRDKVSARHFHQVGGSSTASAACTACTGLSGVAQWVESKLL